MSKRGFWLICCLTTALSIAIPYGWADSWANPAEIIIKSNSGSWEAKVTPAKLTIQIDDYLKQIRLNNLAATPVKDMESWATATVRQENSKSHTFTLRSPWMPVEALLLDDGTLVTFDQWYSMGYGEVCIAYDPSGSVRWSRTLRDLVGNKLIDFSGSVSSIGWRYSPLVWSIETGSEALLIRLSDENQLRIRLADGQAYIIAVASLPDDPKRLYSRANALLGHILRCSHRPMEPNDKQKEAIALLQRAVQLKPEDPSLDLSINDRLLQVFHCLGKHEEAIETGKSALKRLVGRYSRGEFLANLYVDLSESQNELNLIEEAEQSLMAAVSIAPSDYANPSISLARLLYKAGRPDEADSVLNKLLTAPSSMISSTRQSVGNFYKEINQPAKALDCYLMLYNPNGVTNTSLYFDIARSYEKVENLQKALFVYQQLVTYFEMKNSKDDLGAQQKVIQLQKALELKENSR